MIDFPFGGRGGDLAAAQSGAPFEPIEQMTFSVVIIFLERKHASCILMEEHTFFRCVVF